VGFSLIELLVVVAIISLLVSQIMPTLSRAKLLAKRVICAGGQSNIGKAAALYQADHPSYVPVSWRNQELTYANPWPSWRTLLLPYLASFEALNCPAATDVPGGSLLFHSVDEVTTREDWGGTGIAGSYGVIYQKSLPGYTTVDIFGDMQVGHPGYSLAWPVDPGIAWRKPGESVYAADSCLASGPVVYPTVAHKGIGASMVIHPSRPWYGDGTATYRFADRHLGTCCLFVDGHVSSYATAELDAMQPGEGDCVWDVE
jgi:prepilin-type N-terminal cleavage/methylation domain-containing protein